METARFAHGVLRESSYPHLTFSQNGILKPIGDRFKNDSLHTPYHHYSGRKTIAASGGNFKFIE